MNRMCPRAASGGEHALRQDEDGRWYCPIERDAERAEAYRARMAEIEALEAAFAAPAADK